MNYTYQNWETYQVRLFKEVTPNMSVSIAVYNKRKNRVYIGNISILTDDDVEAIKQFINEMRKKNEQ